MVAAGELSIRFSDSYQTIRTCYSNILVERKKLRDAHAEHQPRQDKVRDPLPVVPKKRNGINHGVKPLDCKVTEKPTPYKLRSLKDYERSWRVRGIPSVHGYTNLNAVAAYSWKSSHIFPKPRRSINV
jgi:hypothetical protein